MSDWFKSLWMTKRDRMLKQMQDERMIRINTQRTENELERAIAKQKSRREEAYSDLRQQLASDNKLEAEFAAKRVQSSMRAQRKLEIYKLKFDEVSSNMDVVRSGMVVGGSINDIADSIKADPNFLLNALSKVTEQVNNNDLVTEILQEEEMVLGSDLNAVPSIEEIIKGAMSETGKVKTSAISEDRSLTNDALRQKAEEILGGKK